MDPPNRSLRRAALLAVLATASLVSCNPAPPEPGSVLVDCSAAGTRVQVTVSTHLDSSCTYTAGFDVTASDVTLDCQGAVIRSELGAGGRGIEISSPVDTALSGVTVRNCNVEGFLNSLRVTRPGFRTLPEGEEYDYPTSDIVIEDSTFTGSHGVGVFVDGYVTGVSIRRNRIRNAGSSGIYLETGSKQTRVEGNTLVGNGFRENGPGGQLVHFAGIDFWFWGVGREGISVDGSFENTIVNNLFLGNSAGGIFLYKNCGEFPDSDRYFERRTPSDRNVIQSNLFLGGRNGVWIGSRMAENTLPMACTDPAYIDEFLRRVVLDRAEDNVVRANVFHDVTYGVRVEDDGNQVLDNIFSCEGPDCHAVIIGTPLRTEVLGLPVADTVVTGNVSTITDNRHPYRWIHGHTGTVEAGNLALGAPVSLCEGEPVPRQAIIFVIALAAAGPGGTPPETTPDLSVPILGVPPDCSAGAD
jgi:parallel beta-helix repeat protein